MSDSAREILRELLAEALAGGNGNGVTPQVPPPPVAAVHRPSSYNPQVGVRPLVEGFEQVTIAGYDDLNRFVRVERGAVTERKVAEAAKAGGRLIIGKAAVLTPLAREKARALGVEIEREDH